MQKQRRREDILPIDRPGWGWVVVCAASILFALHAGGFKVSGIILVELIEKYDGVYSQATLLWIFTVKYIITGLMGPIVSVLILKFTHRIVAMFGTFMMCVGWVGLAYSHNMVTMIALHSVPAGIGNGTLAMVCFLVSGQYFIKHKALAVGIVAGGSGIGTLTLPHIMRALYDNFDFGGASLLYGAVCLQCTVLATLLRPITYYERLYAAELSEIDSLEDFDADPSVESLEENSKSGAQEETTRFLNSPETQSDFRERSKSFNDRHCKPDQSDHSFRSHSNLVKTQINGATKNVLDPGTRRTSQHLVSVGDLAGSVYFLEQKGEKGIVAVSKTRAVTATKESMHFRVLTLPKFWMIGMSLFVYALGTSVIYQGVPALALEESISKDTVALMMLVAGGLEIPCRIGNGFLADRRVMTSLNQYSICLFFAGFMALLCAILSGLEGIILVLIGMSSMGTSIFSLVPLVFKDLIGAENVTSAMGIQLACQACGFIVSSSLTGLVYNTTNSWRMVYYYVAGVMMLSSMVTWPYCFYTTCQKKCQSEKSSSATKDDSKIIIAT